MSVLAGLTDAFFVRAMLAGLALAIALAPLGCLVVWRRMAFFGDTLAHGALLGVALGLAFDLDIRAGVLAAALAIAVALWLLERRVEIPPDAFLGILAHGTLAVGLVVLAFLPGVRTDLMAYLFGDILSVGRGEVVALWAGGAALLGIVVLSWRALLAATVDPDLAAAEGVRVEFYRLLLLLLMAAAVAIAIRIVGVLLVTALLVVPAASARPFARSPEGMAAIAAVFGAVSVVAGLLASLQFDTPSGPSIVVASLILFIATLPLSAARLAR